MLLNTEQRRIIVANVVELINKIIHWYNFKIKN